MKKYRWLEEMGNVDEAFLKEVFEYTEMAKCERSHHMNKTFILRIAAVAACAAVVIGVGASAISRKDLPVKQIGEVTEPAEPAQVTKQTEVSGALSEHHSEAVTESVPTSTEAPVPVTEPVTEPTPVSQPIESISQLSEGQSDIIVEVERSYNEKIADGEEVSIETYIGIPYRISSDKYSVVGDFTYTLQNVIISDRLPEGITRDDLTSSVGAVREIDEDGERIISADGDESRALDIGECIDENGVYSGPGNGYKWVFVTVEVTNNSDKEILKYINALRLVGGELRTTKAEVDGRIVDEGFSEYEYFQEACYHSNPNYAYDYDLYYEMAFGGLDEAERTAIEERAVEKYGSVEKYLLEMFYFETHFDAKETKTITIGFPINNYYVYGDLLLELNPTGVANSEISEYIPLK